MKPSKRDHIAAQIDLYLQQVARPAQKRQEPNDRRYDREIERSLRTIKPQDLDALLYGQDDS